MQSAVPAGPGTGGAACVSGTPVVRYMFLQAKSTGAGDCNTAKAGELEASALSV